MVIIVDPQTDDLARIQDGRAQANPLGRLHHGAGELPSALLQFVREGESPLVKGLPYTLLSLFIGWWGFPWGLIYTPVVIIQNLSGGKDVTAAVMDSLAPGMPQRAQGLPEVQVK